MATRNRATVPPLMAPLMEVVDMAVGTVPPMGNLDMGTPVMAITAVDTAPHLMAHMDLMGNLDMAAVVMGTLATGIMTVLAMGIMEADTEVLATGDTEAAATAVDTAPMALTEAG